MDIIIDAIKERFSVDIISDVVKVRWGVIDMAHKFIHISLYCRFYHPLSENVITSVCVCWVGGGGGHRCRFQEFMTLKRQFCIIFDPMCSIKNAVFGLPLA